MPCLECCRRYFPDIFDYSDESWVICIGSKSLDSRTHALYPINHAVLFTVRVYAICGQSKSVAVGAGILMFPRLFLDIWVGSRTLHQRGILWYLYLHIVLQQYSLRRYNPSADSVLRTLRACNFEYLDPTFQTRYVSSAPSHYLQMTEIGSPLHQLYA